MSELDKYRTPETETVKTKQETNLELTEKTASISHGLAKYFSAAIERLDFLEYGDPSEYLLRNHKIESFNSQLSSIWVAPKFKQQNETGEEVPIDTFLADITRCQLVLADPGCGKSTLSRFLCCHFINGFREGREKFFGIFAPLSLIKLSGRTYQEAVAFCAAKYVGLENDSEVIEELKKNLSKACILFDGFDELPVSLKSANENEPPTLRYDVAKLIRSLLFVQANQSEEQNPQRIIITCRIKDYYEDKGSNLGAIPLYFMAKFTPAQMNLAVNKWHEAAKNKTRLNSNSKIIKSLEERRLGVQSAFREYPDLASVCLTPLMLSALLTVYSDKNDLPSSVSQLCWRAINWFFIDKHKMTSQDSFVKEYGNWLIESIIKIGWSVHEHFVSGQQKSFDNVELRKLTDEANIEKEFREADYDTREARITKVASFLRKGHGILVKVSNSEYDFVHNVFREVLAGKALSKLSVPARRKFALNAQWIGPIRYWAGLRVAEPDGMHEISAFVGELTEDVAQKNIDAILACGEMLTEVCSIVSANNLTSDLKRHIIEIRNELCLLLKNADIRITTRVKIGDLLATLGDKRLTIKINERVELIAEDDYVIGRSENHKTRISKYERCPAAPSIKGHLKEFKIGTYLVTNSDFDLFIKSDGYINRKYWKSEVGWNWTSGNKKTIQELIDKANEVANIHLSSELAGNRIVQDEIPNLCSQMINRRLPLYWLDPSYNRPNQPVVGVNWWEAMAYCNWLEDKLKMDGLLETGKKVRLPLESEWEVVARICGQGDQYPWIEGAPSDCALVKAAFDKGIDPPIFRSCGVGLFEYVKTKKAIFDLVGNVWEWTGSKVQSYNSESFVQKIDELSFEDKIARGSSWLSSEEESTQITFRSFDPPYNAYEDLGFRIVIF